MSSFTNQTKSGFPSFNPAWTQFPIGIGVGAQTSTLSSFTLYIDLSLLSNIFWNYVKSDGGDIRVTTSSGTEVPFELVGFNYSLKTGGLWTKVDLTTSPNLFYIFFGNATASGYAPTDPYGSQNVWSNYSDTYHLITNSNDSASSGNNGSAIYVTQTNSGSSFGGEITYLDSLTGSSAQPFGKATVNQKIGQSFVLTENLIGRLDVMLQKFANVGTPTDGANLAVQADVGGAPSGTDLIQTGVNWNGTGAIAANLDYIFYTFDMTSVSLTVGNTYWIVLKRTSTLSDANYPNASYDPLGTTGNLKSFDGTSWNSVTGSLRFRLYKSGYIKFSSAIAGIPIQNLATSFILTKNDNEYECLFANTAGSGSTTGHFEINGSSGPVNVPGRFTYRATSGNQISINTGLSLGDNIPHWITYVRDTISSRIYVDGVLAGTGTTDASGSNTFNYIGVIQQRINANYSVALKGIIREIRFGTSTNITSSRISSEYNNQNSPSTFLSFIYFNVRQTKNSATFTHQTKSSSGATLATPGQAMGLLLAFPYGGGEILSSGSLPVFTNQLKN